MIITCNEVTISIQNRELFKDIKLTIDSGDFIKISGPNGIGKTILIRSLLGLHHEVKGPIERNYDKHKIVFIPDSPFFHDNEMVLFIIKTLQSFYNVDSNVIQQHLSQVGLDFKKIRFLKVHQLSLGMRQKLHILPLFFEDNDFYVLDEIFIGLDRQFQDMIINRLLQLNESKRTIMIIEHNSELSNKFAEMQNFKEVLCDDNNLYVSY